MASVNMPYSDNKQTFHCLVIDDNQDNCFILNKMLSDLDLQVTVADSPLDGLMFCEQQEFDLILLDWMMPGLDGIEFIDRLRGTVDRAFGEEADLPKIVMCTGRDDEADIHKAISRGVDGYIVKPFSEETLVAQLRDIHFLH